jgi:hypothetical protein
VSPALCYMVCYIVICCLVSETAVVVCAGGRPTFAFHRTVHIQHTCCVLLRTATCAGLLRCVKGQEKSCAYAHAAVACCTAPA